MKKIFVLLSFVSLNVSAQDVIVKKDGSTILSKVLEVNQNDIKYKKYSNQNGPTYTISKAELMSINYEGGDKDVFTDSQPATQQEPANGGFEVNPNLEADNLKLVQQFNQRELVYNGKQGKKANDFIGVLGLKEGSILETPELKVDFAIKRFLTKFDGKETEFVELGEKSNLAALGLENMVLVVTLTNKSNRSIYIDQGNSFVLHYQKGVIPFYTPKSSTTGTASSDGSSVAFGGSHVGFIVGSSEAETSSTTIYSQRIVTIPPKGTISLEPQDVGLSYHDPKYKVSYMKKMSDYLVMQCYLPFFLQKSLVEENDKYYAVEFDKLKIGESIDVPMQDDNPFSVHLTYSFDEQQKATQSMRQDFYLRKLIGVDDKGFLDLIGRIDFEGFDLSQKPLLYLIRGRKIWK